MDPQKPAARPGVRSSAVQTTTAIVTCQARATQMAPAVASPSTSGYVLTSSSLRPMANYRVVAADGSQVPVTAQYIVQSAGRAAPQYVTAGGVKHVRSANSGQTSSVAYVLSSGAHIVRMNNVTTASAAVDQRPQYILTTSAQKVNTGLVSSLDVQKAQNTAVTCTTTSGTVTVPRSIGMTTSVQRSNIHIPKLNATYYSQIKGIDPSKISFRPKLNEQKPSTSYVLTPNDWSLAKNKQNVPMSSLQKVNTNYMQLPVFQKPATVRTTNAIKPNVNIQQQIPQQQRPQQQRPQQQRPQQQRPQQQRPQQQRPQQQRPQQQRPQQQKSQQPTIRSVILPTNFCSPSGSQQQNTDCKLVLNSVPQVLNSTDGNSNTLNTPVSNIQQLNKNYLQFPLAQKPGNIITRTNVQPSTETNNVSNLRIGQQQTIRSVILPANYRTAMMSSTQKGVDYRLILKPVNMQSSQPNVIKNIQIPRFHPPRNASIRNTAFRPPVYSARPMSLPIRVPITRLTTAAIPQDEIIADSVIKSIPPTERKSHLVISKKSIQICIDEINFKRPTMGQPYLNLTEPAFELVQAEVTYRLFYLLRECKKMLHKSRSNVLTEDSVRRVCAEYFATFYGNKLWPLFCLNQENSTDDDLVWMRKHNNVNLIGWIKHSRFRTPSFIKKRPRKKVKESKLSLQELM